LRRFFDVTRWFIGSLRRLTQAGTAAAVVFVAYPSLISHQDIGELSQLPLANRWLAHVPEGPGASHFKSDAVAAIVQDPIRTGSTGVATVERSKDLADITSKITTDVRRPELAQRIRRMGMGDRVISYSVARPPAYFSAGSVLERQSWVEPLNLDRRTELAFVQPLPMEQAFAVASAFHDKNEARAEPPEDIPLVVASLVDESAQNLLSYGNENEPIRSPFASILDEQRPINLIPKLKADDHDWAGNPLSAAVLSETEQNCLTAGIYFEARGESTRGQAAVAQVILNRVKSPAYPDTICGVVYQNKDWRNRCQFSFACDKVKDRVRDPKHWEIAAAVARETTEGRIWLPEVGSSTHYHANYVQPRWANRMKKAAQIGLHIFYKTFGGGWS
jgi:spore germination cell wall hydrolase CwlJ-like protein